MKVCEKCGAINNNERFFCADCGEKLPAPVSKAYEAEINGRISDTGDKLMRESDPLAVTTFDRITGFVSVGGLLLAVVLLFVGARLQRFNPELILYSMLFFIVGIISSFLPRLLWFFERRAERLVSFLAQGRKPFTLRFRLFAAFNSRNCGIIGIIILIICYG